MDKDEFLLCVLLGLVYGVSLYAVRTETGLLADDLSIAFGFMLGVVSLKIIQAADKSTRR